MLKVASPLLIVGLLLVSAGCESPVPDGEEEPRSEAVEESPEPAEEKKEEAKMEFPELATYGALRNINLHDDYSPATTLRQARGEEPWPNHGVGALGGLSGEITLWDDELYLAHAGDSPRFEQSSFAEVEPEVEATMFFAASVDRWQAIDPMDVDELSALEAGLEAWRVDQEKEGAIPFRIIDPRATVDFHVVDAERIPEEGAGSCEERKEYGHQYGVIESPVRLVGIFTTDHTGVVVDHRTSLHIHVITEDGRSGHVDALNLSEEAVIEIGYRQTSP